MITERLTVGIDSTARSGRRRATCHCRAPSVLLGAAAMLAAAATTPGKPVAVDEARRAVSAWLAAHPRPLGTTLAPLIGDIKAYPAAGDIGDYYAVSLEPEGFVIVPGDDRVEPILAFSAHGRYEPDEDNCLAALVIRDVAGRLDEARRVRADAQVTDDSPPDLREPLRAAQTRWQDLLGPSPLPAGIAGVSDVRVPPLVQSRWGQGTACGGFCYDYYTPERYAGVHYPCGCVATAMAQVMRYFQHPSGPVGTPVFTFRICDLGQDRQPLRGGDGAGGPYDWANMVLVPHEACAALTEPQRQAIGTLCYDAAISVHSEFGRYVSGRCNGTTYSDVTRIPEAYKGAFGYGNAVAGFNAGANIGPGLIGMLNPNLDAHRPVILGVAGTSTGHAVVCDGYGYDASTLYHHINFGWSGGSDAWYNLPNTGSFTVVDQAAYNICTAGAGEIISGRVTDANGNPIAGAVVLALRTGGGSYTAATDDRGIYACTEVPSGSQYLVSVAAAGRHFAQQTVLTGTSIDGRPTSGNVWAVDFVAASVPGDFDFDGDADLIDFVHFQACFNGPNRAPASADCADADFDGDNDVDLADFGTFQSCFNGPNRPPACT